MVTFALSGLFNACMYKTNIGYCLDNGLTINGKYEAQNAMRARMLRPHIDCHGILVALLISWLILLDRCFLLSPGLLHAALLLSCLTKLFERREKQAYKDVQSVLFF